MLSEKLLKFWQPALSGLLLGLSYPPLPTGFIAWFALLPLIKSVEKCSLKEAAMKGAVFAAIHSALSLYFIACNRGAPPLLAIASWLGVILVLTLTGPLFTIPLNLIIRRWKDWGLWSIPFIWTSLEYLRSLGEIAFPWNIFPLTQSMYLPLIQITALTGLWGLSFWVGMINLLLFLILYRSRKWMVPFAIWTAALFIFGLLALHNPPPAERTLKVAIVQGNVEPESKWANGLSYNLKLYERLSENISGVDLVVWPETAVPAKLNHELSARRFLRDLSRRLDTPILTGALAWEENPPGDIDRFNSAYLVKPEKLDFQRYDKINLVPFGERVPFQKVFPSLGRLNFGQAEFKPGENFVIFPPDSTSRFGVMICYESVVPYISRKYVSQGANFLVNITNDGWYGKTAEPYQQGMLTRFRAVENSRSLIRAANTGISFVFDPQGRILAQSHLEVEDILKAEIPLIENQTIYQHYGDYLGKIILFITLGIIMITLTANFLSARLAKK